MHYICMMVAISMKASMRKKIQPLGGRRFDFTKPHVLSFLKSAIDFWLSRYHFDGIRYDAVSNLIYHDGDREKESMNRACGF